MSERLKGNFVGRPYHDDDYEACIQYSGQAPCDTPDGWQLVPKKATDSMKLAAWKVWDGYGDAQAQVWKAMLQDAPIPGQEDQCPPKP